MNKKLIAMALAVVALGAGAFALARPSGAGKASAQQRNAAPPPDYVLYRMLFHDVYLRKQQALKVESEGKPEKASAWRNAYKRDAQLNDNQEAILEQISEQAESAVAEQDAKARVIIERDKARYPDGKVPQGQKVQPPSPELYAMQQERNAIILRFRDQLHNAFGDAEFARFQGFVNQKLARNVTTTQAGQ